MPHTSLGPRATWSKIVSTSYCGTGEGREGVERGGEGVERGEERSEEREGDGR